MGALTAGGAPRSWSKILKPGTCFPSTTRHAVIGVDSTSPSGPHSQAQITAARITATPDRPTLWPYRSGSMTLLLSSSTTMNSAATDRGCVQPDDVTRLPSRGRQAPLQRPTYGE